MFPLLLWARPGISRALATAPPINGLVGVPITTVVGVLVVDETSIEESRAKAGVETDRGKSTWGFIGDGPTAPKTCLCLGEDAALDGVDPLGAPRLPKLVLL